MRSFWLILLLCAPLVAPAQQTSPAPQAGAMQTVIASTDVGGGSLASAKPFADVPAVNSSTSPKLAAPNANEQHRAQREFREGLKLQHSHPREALLHFEAAASLAPGNIEYITAREVARQKLVYDTIQRGNAALAAGKNIEALGSFREALDLDPQNQFARQQLQASLPRLPKMDPLAGRNLLPEAVELRPDPDQRNFHLRGNTRDIINQVALAYGVTPVLDDSVANRFLRLDLEQATWPMAISALTRLTKTLWTPLSARQALFAADTDDNRRSLERAASRTFYLPQAATPQTLNEIASAVRILFEARFVTVDPTAGTLTIRTNARVLDAINEFLKGLQDQQPQVVFDVNVFQVSRSFTRAMGANVPTEFQLFNIPTELEAALSNSSVQSLVNQLISSGLINQANTTAIAALIAQALGGQSSLLSQPFAVFGGGITFSALTLPATSGSLSRDLSSIQTLQTITLRAAQNTPAIMKIGERYPILNAIFSPIYNSAAISRVISNQTFQAPFPSYSYQDLGFDLKATPIIHHDNSISVKLEMQIRALGAQSVNGIPIVTNREFNSYIDARNGEAIVAAGNLTQSESRVLHGYPLVSALPGVGRAFSTETKQETDDELLVILTPHIVTANPEAGVPVLLPYATPRP